MTASCLRSALVELGVIDEQLDAALLDIELNAIAVAHECERPADRAFGRDVQHDRAERGAAHARVRNPNHVLDAGARELFRDRQVAGLRHSRRTLRAGVTQHEHVVGSDIERVVVDSRSEIFERIEHHRATRCAASASAMQPIA